MDELRRSLYGGSRATFVERRKGLAGAARRVGDRDQAKLIEQMRKPAAAAHLLNLLAQADDSSLQQLVDLGASIRRAMADGDDQELRVLLRRRPDAIAATAAQARAVARECGESVSGAVGDQIVQTLRAAMASDEAAAAVRGGTLTDGLDEPGVEGFGSESAVRAPSGTRRRPAQQRSESDVEPARQRVPPSAPPRRSGSGRQRLR